MSRNKILLNLFIKIVLTCFLFSGLYFILNSLNTNMYVSVVIKQSMDKPIELYYRDYLESPFSGYTVKNIQNKSGQSDVYERYIFVVPENHLDNLRLRVFADESGENINTIDIKSITAFSLFNIDNLKDFEDYQYIATTRVEYINLFDDYIFNKWDLEGKLKLVTIIISIIIIVLLSKKIDGFFCKNGKLYKEKFISCTFAGVLISVFLINTIVLDKDYSYIDRRNTIKKPELESYIDILNGNYFEGLSEYYRDNFLYREFLLEDYYAFNRAMGQKAFNTKYIDKEGDDIHIWLSNKASFNDIEDNAENIVKLNELIVNKGIPFQYYSIPDKESLNIEKVPTYLAGEANNKKYGEVFVSTLKDGDVDVYDMYNMMKEDFVDEGLETHYVLDTHWRFETAFATYQSMLDNLIENNILDEDDRLTKEDFNYTIYENQFSGWLGRSIGYGYRYNQELDDLTVIEPNEDIRIEYIDNSKNKSTEGHWSEFIDDALINSIEKYAYKYGVYINSTNYTLNNLDNKNGKKAVLLRDSFGVPISWFLINNFESITVLDQRYLDENYVVDYLENEYYDVVLGISYYNSTYNESLYNFFD